MDQGKKKLLIKARRSNTAEQDIIEQIRIGTGHNFEARLDQAGKPYPSLANMGAKKHQLAQMTREGEYHGITIKLLEPIYPSLTNLLIIKLLNHIEKHEEQIAMNLIDPRFVKYGIEGLHYIVSTWLKRQQFNIPNFIQATKVQDQDLDRYISREYHSPIDVPFTLISPGFNEAMGSSVVPEEWIDRNFMDAQQFHNEMDQLPWRIGKPPVTYCLTYSMNVIEEVSWSQNQVQGLLIIIDDNMHTQYVDSKQFDNSQQKYDILRINNKDSLPLHIGIHKGQYFNDIPLYPSNERVSLLASRMQKCIRRGRQCSQVLADTIKELIQCKSYSLPDMKMARVSASRQLLWRLYISTVEDSLVYLPTEGYLDLFTMAALALICQNDTSLQLNQKITNIILHTALAIQSMDGQDDIWEWRIDKQKNMIGSTQIYKDQIPTNLLDSLKISMAYQPMMGGDKVMLGNYQIICELLIKSFQCPYKIKVTKLVQKPVSEFLMLSNAQKCLDCKQASMDMHCSPILIILLQAFLPFAPSSEYTTQKIASFIWESSSKFNVRYHTKIELNPKQQRVYKVLRELQHSLLDGYPKNQQKIKNNQIEEEEEYDNQVIPVYISRLAFIQIFGRKFTLDYKNRKYDVSLCGTSEAPCKVKFANEVDGAQPPDEVKQIISEIYLKTLEQEQEYDLDMPPPFGYVWNYQSIKVKLVKNQFIGSENFSFFDAGILLKSRKYIQGCNLEPEALQYIQQLLYIFPQQPDLHLLNPIGKLYSWKHILQESPIPKFQIISLLYCRLMQNDTIQFSITREGMRSQQELSYEYEGMVLRMMHLLQFVYPKAFNGSHTKWTILKNSQQYFQLITDINEILSIQRNAKQGEFSIKTKLWDHQASTVQRISHGFLTQGKRGYGDSSCVGGGKTLTALAVMQKLYEVQNQSHSGFLVLVPQKILIQTWLNEIYKHTRGCHILVQLSNGVLVNVNYNENFQDKIVKQQTLVQIQKNSIVISTLGRFRDHGIQQCSFNLMVVDECLSIQNNDTFQTQAACKQSYICKYGTMLLSATFFRSRFDKLFYLLQILNTQIPNNKEYLDSILHESMVCFIKQNQKQWTTNLNRFELGAKQREEYEQIRALDISPEIKYMKLTQYLHHNFDILSNLQILISRIENEYNDCRILIYGQSKEESHLIASLKNVGLYPNLNERHVTVPYTIGVYGLNDLVCCNIIVTRPPEPDKLPQMKGRLDRPGQTAESLIMQYFIVSNTVEEALLLRLELANRFINQYIMPLAQFYSMAIENQL